MESNNVHLARLNQQTLVDLIGEDMPTIARFQRDFVTQAESSCKLFLSAYSSAAYPELKEHAHFLKTSARAIGAERCSEYLAQLEEAALSADRPHCRRLLISIAQEVKALNALINHA
ncbi:Hpt domain-containing protein [Pseudoalteromonas sp. DL2-H2.2]|uniref:Hpt domain-containing protein n=1 Tax=Pseudoalteromonas sp. DL2-H2.2 TaxID=2908889 RepID=UPI001F3000F3|nr:Hpt domain-containing protein [Pseudoalteromonas sp. DL2-H2.2]MCF2907858.1 Hpt domain-containing protein [Pseudoalteromonas sp. DL2-H2.2]